MVRLSKRVARSNGRLVTTRSRKIALVRSKSSKQEANSSGQSTRAGLRGRSTIGSGLLADDCKPQRASETKMAARSKKQNVSIKNSTRKNLRVTRNRIGNLKKTGSLDRKIRKKVTFFMARPALVKQRDPVSVTKGSESSTRARGSENSGYRLRGRFMNLRNTNSKPLHTKIQTVKSSVLVDKSNAAPQPAGRSTRLKPSIHKPRDNVGPSNGPSTRSSASQSGSNRNAVSNLDDALQAKPFIIKLELLLNCPICGKVLNTAMHTCGR